MKTADLHTAHWACYLSDCDHDQVICIAAREHDPAASPWTVEVLEGCTVPNEVRVVRTRWNPFVQHRHDVDRGVLNNLLEAFG